MEDYHTECLTSQGKFNLEKIPTTSQNPMPKFKMETEYDLIPHLKNLGMTDVFDPKKADLSGIANILLENLFVAKALQKAYVDVNEKGTEAAAVTAIIVVKDSYLLHLHGLSQTIRSYF